MISSHTSSWCFYSKERWCTDSFPCTKVWLDVSKNKNKNRSLDIIEAMGFYQFFSLSDASTKAKDSSHWILFTQQMIYKKMCAYYTQ